jgi:flagellar protein FlgJ
MNLPTSQVAYDSRGLDDLKRAARESPDKALKAAATQFEALFMNMILKSMRDSLPKDGLMSSSAGDTYTGMLDQQLSQKLASQGTGLADMLVRQLSRNMKPAAAAGAAAAGGGVPPADMNGANRAPLSAARTYRLHELQATPPAKPSAMPSIPAAVPLPAADSTKAPASKSAERKREFVARVAEHAKAAETQTGVPAKFIVGQAALESGWGKHEIRDRSGQSAFNLFGIKATGNWRGSTVDVTTTEFVNGVAKKVVEKFRAYASYAEGFADYARVIADNPRYANVLKTARQGVENFALGLQRAGYATDPAYATKLARVINDAAHIDRQA